MDHVLIRVIRVSVVELLRREGGDDFFETRIASQRIPGGQQFQLTVGEEVGYRIAAPSVSHARSL
jgi:hypothetical protein